MKFKITSSEMELITIPAILPLIVIIIVTVIVVVICFISPLTVSHSSKLSQDVLYKNTKKNINVIAITK